MQCNVLFNTILIAVISLTSVACQQSPDGDASTQTFPATPRGIPTFRVDQNWPQLPAHWRLGEVSSIAIDAQDNAWFPAPSVDASHGGSRHGRTACGGI